MENEQADAGRSGRKCPARLNSQARTGTQGNVHFSYPADLEQYWQPYPVDQYSAINYGHTYIQQRCPDSRLRYESLSRCKFSTLVHYFLLFIGLRNRLKKPSQNTVQTKSRIVDGEKNDSLRYGGTIGDFRRRNLYFSRKISESSIFDALPIAACIFFRITTVFKVKY